jgi:acetolactate synthase I/II/III large subunit
LDTYDDRAASFGVKGMRANNLGEFENMLQDALQSLEEIVLFAVALQN